MRLLLTEEELARIKKAAALAGLPWATWVRLKALEAAKKDDAWGQLNRHIGRGA